MIVNSEILNTNIAIRCNVCGTVIQAVRAKDYNWQAVAGQFFCPACYSIIKQDVMANMVENMQIKKDNN